MIRCFSCEENIFIQNNDLLYYCKNCNISQTKSLDEKSSGWIFYDENYVITYFTVSKIIRITEDNIYGNIIYSGYMKNINSKTIKEDYKKILLLL